MGFFILVDMHRRNLETDVPGRVDRLSRGRLVELLDMHHQHMQMKQFLLLHHTTSQQCVIFSHIEK